MTTLKMRVLPQFPSKVIGESVVTVTKTNGTWSIGFDISTLSQTTMADPANFQFLVRDKTLGVNNFVEVPDFIDSVGSGITKASIGLGNVDNTSDATKNSAVATLTNKDLTSGTNTFPTFNQNTTGSAAKWTTARNLAGNSVDGSANVAFANKFIVQGTSDAGLSAAQFMGSLGTGIVKNTTTTGVLSIATAGTDYSAGTSGLATGILKSTTSTGALTIAVAADFPTLNQNTTGSAASFTGSLVGDVSGTQGATVIGANKIMHGMLNNDVITGMTVNNAPNASNDYLLYYSASDGTLRKVTVGSVSAAATAGVSSFNGRTGGVSSAAGDYDGIPFAQTGLQVKGGSSNALTIKPNETLSAARTLNVVTGDADRTVTLGGNITTAAAFVTSGANSLTLTTTGATNVTLPTSGTLATVTRTVNAQTGTTYTLVLGDAGALVTLSNASAITLTIPPNSSVAFPINTQVDLLELGAGQVTPTAGAGVTLLVKSGKTKLTGQYSAATLVKTATDTWVLFGDLA